MKKVFYKTVCGTHDLIRWFNGVCFVFLAYTFFADFGLWPKLTNHCPWYVAFPVGTFLVRLRFSQDEPECPITTMEKKLNQQLATIEN
jgi:hypothetical protein